MLKYLPLLILQFLIVHGAFAQEYVVAEGRFKASPEDSPSFIKEQVIYEGYLDAITKELKAMGLNDELFWQKYKEKFENSFSVIDASLKNKFEIGTGKETQRQKELYANQRRYKRLKLKTRFGNLKRAIQSYAIKRYTRSQQDTDARYVRIEAKVNRNLLSRLYYNYIRGKKSSAYGSLFLNVKYNLVKTSFTDLGVENGKDFTQVVNNHWLKWFSENKPANIANVEILKEDKLKRLNNYFKLPYERMMQEIPEVFVNSLYLELVVDIEKTGENEKFKEYEFRFSGGGFLLDLQTNKILSTVTMPSEDKKYRNLKYDKLSTILANHVYRMPLGKFTSLKRVIKNITPLNSIHRISLYDFANIGDVHNLIDLIQTKGIKHSLKAKLESLGSSRAELIVFMDGQLADLKGLLNSLESAKKGLSFDLIDTDNVLGLKFNKVELPQKENEDTQG